MSPPEKTSRYIYKPLPPLPPLPGKSPKQRLGDTVSSNSLDITATRRISTFPVAAKARDRRGTIKKIENFLEHKLDRFTRQPKVDQLVGKSSQVDGGSPQLPEIAGLSKLDHHNHVDTFSDIRRYMRSDSEYSLSSTSVYSQDNTVEEIVDIYSKWGSWAPKPESPASPAKRSMYLQPGMYCAGATELGSWSHTANARQPSRASIDGAQTSLNTTTLADLITEEQERFGANTPRNRSRFSCGDTTNSVYDQISPKANTLNEDDVHRLNFTPQPPALRPKGFHESHCSMSRWSDHSSDGGMISNARDSVISHIRSMSSPFKTPSRSSIVFQEKVATSTIEAPPPGPGTLKRALPSGKHPLKSPFPFETQLHKRAHSDDSPVPKRSSFARRISDSFKHFSGIRNSRIIHSRIISNHARKGDGPDTPIPTKPGLMGIISPTAVFFQKGTLQIQDAMQKARRAAKVRSRDERRRDKLRKKIVVVGTADPSPTVSRWV